MEGSHPTSQRFYEYGVDTQAAPLRNFPPHTQEEVKAGEGGIWLKDTRVDGRAGTQRHLAPAQSPGSLEIGV